MIRLRSISRWQASVRVNRVLWLCVSLLLFTWFARLEVFPGKGPGASLWIAFVRNVEPLLSWDFGDVEITWHLFMVLPLGFGLLGCWAGVYALLSAVIGWAIVATSTAFAVLFRGGGGGDGCNPPH